MNSTESLGPPSPEEDEIRALLTVPNGSEVADAIVEATRRVLQRRLRVVLLIRNAYERMTTNATVLEAVWDDLRAALRLLVAWTKRSYRQVSTAAVVVLVAALVYFVTPTDFIPDALAVVGFVDDLAVVRTAVETIRDELDRFRSWEETHSLTS